MYRESCYFAIFATYEAATKLTSFEDRSMPMHDSSIYIHTWQYNCFITFNWFIGLVFIVNLDDYDGDNQPTKTSYKIKGFSGCNSARRKFRNYQIWILAQMVRNLD